MSASLFLGAATAFSAEAYVPPRKVVQRRALEPVLRSSIQLTSSVADQSSQLKIEMSFAAEVLQKMLREAKRQPPAPGDDTDVQLLVGSNPDEPGSPLAVLRAHRIVLATVSPVFHEWFHADTAASALNSSHQQDQSPDSKRSLHRILVIHLHDFQPEAVNLALDIIYGGTSLETDNWTVAGQSWDFAVRFRVPHLRDLCRSKVLAMLDHSNALSLLEFALSIDDEPAIDNIADFITSHENFMVIIRSDGFLLAAGYVLEALTNRPGPGSIVEGENMTVEKAWFDAIMAWLTVPRPQETTDHNVSESASEDTTVHRSRRRPSTNYPRMRHVDHVLGLVEFTRMKTHELAMTAENATACHAAYFPNCLIPLLAERTMLLEQDRESRDNEIKELSEAFASAVFAKNEAERSEMVLRSRVDKTKAEVKKLRATLESKTLQMQSPMSAQITFRSPSTSPVEESFTDPALDPSVLTGADPRPRAPTNGRRQNRRDRPLSDTRVDLTAPEDLNHRSEAGHRTAGNTKSSHRRFRKHSAASQDASETTRGTTFMEMHDEESQWRRHETNAMLKRTHDSEHKNRQQYHAALQVAGGSANNNSNSSQIQQPESLQQQEPSDVAVDSGKVRKSPFYGDPAVESYDIVQAWQKTEQKRDGQAYPIHEPPLRHIAYRRAQSRAHIYESRYDSSAYRYHDAQHYPYRIETRQGGHGGPLHSSQQNY